MRKYILFLVLAIPALNATQEYIAVPTEDSSEALERVDPEVPSEEQNESKTSNESKEEKNFWWPVPNDDEAMIKKKRMRRRLGGLGLTLFSLTSFAGDGMSIGGSQAINSQLSPITSYAYVRNETTGRLVPPAIEHKSGCIYTEYADGYPPDSWHSYIKGNAWCMRGAGCKATIETCQGTDKYIPEYKVTLAGQIISLVTKAPLMGPFLGLGIKLLMKP